MRSPFIACACACFAAWSASTIASAADPAPALDKFGVGMLFPTKAGAREWFSTWDNGKARGILSGDRDPSDAEFIVRGDGRIDIDGKGVATASGDAPRMYLYDAARAKKWQNVEITFYGRRGAETGKTSSQGFAAGARSEHQDASNTSPCFGRTYYGRLLYDGRACFQKEVVHHGAYSSNQPSESNKAKWETPDGTMPKDIWIGFKYIVQNVDHDSHVRLTLYRDLTDGKDGGTWEKVAEYLDTGEWAQTDSGMDVQAHCGFSPAEILLKPGTCVFVRNDEVSRADYKKFSVREIEPGP